MPINRDRAIESVLDGISSLIKSTKFKDTRTNSALCLAMLLELFTQFKYERYSKIAEENGLIHISDKLMELSKNEMEHGKVWFKELGISKGVEHPAKDKNGEPEVSSPYPTQTNVDNAKDTEWSEYLDIYPYLAEIAHEEGNYDIENKMLLIASIEKEHSKILGDILTQLDNLPRNAISDDQSGTDPDANYKWKCSKCGNIHIGSKPVDKCPVCDHPGSFYELVT